MTSDKIVYSSDIHGNETQYQKLVDLARQEQPLAVIVGGDLAPKHFSHEQFIQGQRDFLRDRLPELFALLKKDSPETRIFLMMGNDDCASNLDVLEESDIFEVIHGKRIQLTSGLELVGYSYVPISPFGIKDWEKMDLTNISFLDWVSYINRLKKYAGCKSTLSGWQDFEFTDSMRKTDSIELDLSQELYRSNAEKTIYVIHTPPNKTKLDQTRHVGHVGSFAVRSFIKTTQPYLTLHGHIHETVEVSGSFKDHIGKTLCLTSGNDNTKDELAALVLDINEPEKVRRIII